MSGLSSSGKRRWRWLAAVVVAALAASLLAPAAAGGAAPTMDVAASSIEGWTVESGTAAKIVGKVKVTGLRVSRTRFAITAAHDVTNDSALAADVFTIRNNGRVSYSGTAIVGNSVKLTIAVTDSRNRAAAITAAVTVAVTNAAVTEPQRQTEAQGQTQAQRSNTPATALELKCARENGYKGRPPSQRARCEGVDWERHVGYEYLICDAHTHVYTYRNAPSGMDRLPLTYEVATKVVRFADPRNPSQRSSDVKTITGTATLTSTPYDGKTYKLSHRHSRRTTHNGQVSACGRSHNEAALAQHDAHHDDFGTGTDPDPNNLKAPGDFATGRAYWVYKWKQRQQRELTSAALVRARWFDCLTHTHRHTSREDDVHSSCDAGHARVNPTSGPGHTHGNWGPPVLGNSGQGLYVLHK